MDTAALRADAWRPRPGRLLGDVLVELGLVDRDVVEQAVLAARTSGRPMGKVLVESGAVTADGLAAAVAGRFGLEHLRLDSFQVDPAAANLIAPAVARRLAAVPVAFRGEGTLLVAMVNPSNVLAVDDIAMLTDHRVQPAVVSDEDLLAIVRRLTRLDEGLADEAPPDPDPGPVEELDLRETGDDAPTVRLVHSVLAQAVDQGASDVHFDPVDGELRVRLRIDGVMADATRVPRALAPKVVSRIKILADLDSRSGACPRTAASG